MYVGECAACMFMWKVTHECLWYACGHVCVCSVGGVGICMWVSVYAHTLCEYPHVDAQINMV